MENRSPKRQRKKTLLPTTWRQTARSDIAAAVAHPSLWISFGICINAELGAQDQVGDSYDGGVMTKRVMGVGTGML